jgi:hypothetical protein
MATYRPAHQQEPPLCSRLITETNRIHLVLFGTQRTLHPNVAAIHRTIILVMSENAMPQSHSHSSDNDNNKHYSPFLEVLCILHCDCTSWAAVHHDSTQKNSHADSALTPEPPSSGSATH